MGKAVTVSGVSGLFVGKRARRITMFQDWCTVCSRVTGFSTYADSEIRGFLNLTDQMSNQYNLPQEMYNAVHYSM